MKNKAIILLSLICIILIFNGCLSRHPENNNLDTKFFYSNYKQDANFFAGKKSAVHNGRVYYFSNENEKRGIYSMKMNGNDLQLEFETPDVRKIQIDEKGTVYVLEHFKMYKNENGMERQFAVACYEKNNNTYTKNWLLGKAANNLWDFYISDDTAVYLYVQYKFASGMPELLGFCTLNGIVASGNEYLSITSEKKFDTSIAPLRFNIIQLNNLWLGLNERYSDYEKNEEMYDFYADTAGIIDLDHNIMVLGDNYVFGSYDRTIRSVNEKGVINSIKNEISIIDPNTNTLIDIKTLLGEKEVLFILDKGEYAYIISSSNSELHSLYKWDLEDFEIKKVYSEWSYGKILWVDENKLIVANNNKIHIKQLNEDTVNDVFVMTLQDNIIQKEYKTDVAGEWLFIYKFEETQNSDILQYKINMATGKTVRCV